MPLTHYKPNSAGYMEIAVGPEITAAVQAEAERGLGIAVGLSQPFDVTGEYVSSFLAYTQITQMRTRFGVHPVATGVLQNVSPHAAAVEFGNKDDHKAHHVMAKTGEAMAGG